MTYWDMTTAWKIETDIILMLDKLVLVRLKYDI